MSPLLLRDESKSTDWQAKEICLWLENMYGSDKLMLKNPRYIGYIPEFGQTRSFVLRVDIKESKISKEALLDSIVTFAIERQGVAYGAQYFLPAETKGRASNQPYLHQSAQDVHIYPVIFADLSQTEELFGYALPRRLQLNIEQSAFNLLQNVTLASLTQKVLDRIYVEKLQESPIRSVNVTSFKDPEATHFEQLVIEVHLDCGPDDALRIWDELSNNIEKLKESLSPHEINVLNEMLGLDCEW